MLKFAVTLLLIFSITLISTTAPTLAQPGTSEPTERTPQPAKSEKPDLQKVFAKETAKIKAESETFDPVKADLENSRQQQTQKKGWSTTKKTLVITAIALGVAAVLFIVIKYGKDCLRSDPADCTPGVDENCVCLEYERRIPKGQ